MLQEHSPAARRESGSAACPANRRSSLLLAVGVQCRKSLLMVVFCLPKCCARSLSRTSEGAECSSPLGSLPAHGAGAALLGGSSKPPHVSASPCNASGRAVGRGRQLNLPICFLMGSNSSSSWEARAAPSALSLLPSLARAFFKLLTFLPKRSVAAACVWAVSTFVIASKQVV